MDQESVSQTALDQMVSNDQAQLLKAAVPYLPPKGQQIISLYTKIKELNNTMALFSPQRTSMQICSSPVSDPVSIIQDIRKFSYGPTRKQLDQLQNMMALVEIMKLMNE